MEDKVFGKLEYKGGWYRSETIEINGHEFKLELNISAYENETPNVNQQDSYKRFKEDFDSIMKIGKKKFSEYINLIKEDVLIYSGIKEIPDDLLQIITPKKILFMESGNFAILFDSLWDEHGVAMLCREFDIVVGPQDIIWKYE